MKFSEFVGHKKTKEIKKVVNTNIGPTEEDFLKIIARENCDEYYLGFSINKKNLKRIFDYIKSWFIRYHLPYTSINPYLTIYLLKNIVNKNNFINNIKSIRKEPYYPLDDGTITIVKDNNKINILLDYINTEAYEKKLEKIFNNMNIDIIESCCYIKLFEVEDKKGIIDNKFCEDMMYSCPIFPKIGLGNIGILRR